jgi:hypothetical protein
MSRPEHLNCVNTPEGIKRINENQELYDKDPEEYERRQRYEQEQRDLEEIQKKRVGKNICGKFIGRIKVMGHEPILFIDCDNCFCRTHTDHMLDLP